MDKTLIAEAKASINISLLPIDLKYLACRINVFIVTFFP